MGIFNTFKRFDKIDRLVLLIGLCVTIKVRVIGIFSIAEFILMFMTVFTSCNQYKKNPYTRKMFVFAILWLIGTIASNIYNHIEMLSFIKGVFFLVVLLLIIPSVYKVLYEKPERIVLFFLGYGFGSLIARYTTTEAYLSETLSSGVYKYYAMMFCVSGIGFWIYFCGKKKLGIMLCYGITVIGLFHMARNPFLTGTVALFMLIAIQRMLNFEDGELRFRKDIPKYLIYGILAVWAASAIYEPLAANGTLGEEAQTKYLRQKDNGGALEGGRMVTFMGFEFACENPIWGYGSYAMDIGNKMKQEYADKHNIVYVDPGYDTFIPAHSHIIGAWVENGFLGLLFWLVMLYYLWKAFSSGCLLQEPRLLCLFVFRFSAFLWDVIFSPFGDRVFTSFLLISLFIVYDNYKKGLYELELVQRLNI